MSASIDTSHTTFVLVPGSFSTPAEYDKLKTLLELQNHKVTVIDLLSANDGSRMPPATMEEDAEHIRQTVVNELDNNNRNVVLALHSYAGVPGSTAMRRLGGADRKADGKSTAVLGIVYIAALMVGEGQCLRDVMSEYLPEPMKSGTPGEYLAAIDAAMIPYVFNDVDEAEGQKYFAGMTRQSSDSYSGKCSYAAWKDIPSVQLVPKEDMTVPVPAHEAMHQHTVDMGANVKKVYLDGLGHCPNISRPQMVVDQLVGLAQH